MELAQLPDSRVKVREYLQGLFNVLSYPDGEEWPNVSRTSFRELIELVEGRCQVERARLPGNDKASYEARMAIYLYQEFIRELIWLDWSVEPSKHEIDPSWNAIVEGRPTGTMEFDQLFCTVDATFRRAQETLMYVSQVGGKVLCLGDDDLVSLALREYWDGEIHVIDLDTRLLDFIKEKDPSIHCHKFDLDNDSIPDDLRGQFDVVLYDPPWEKYPAWLFLQWADACLKPEANVHILMSFCPLYLEYDEKKLDQVFQDFTKAGFGFDAIHPRFSLYSMGEENNPELVSLLNQYEIPLESLFLDQARKLPYVFSNMYVIRRLHPQGRWPWLRKLMNLWRL